ncbi:hypothetical protein [Allomesorhizobium alhagi]|uniref:Uncharacterized protein n=1 Tax=Mesorhizobium alhagi CCNWXJ12-2 TaxID=1107882 RepID=H0HQT9_9HYPH|nr:hypothetical protein [Mesorhizobium alhagi]EHK56903.1 hypothetical protein MAXJ12_12597 [Mesorhizobium alhagi CCNWXJ12-2]
MAGFEAFERDLRIATAGLEPEAISKELARFARAELAKAIAAGASPQYERYVNGRAGAPEESVVAPGPIVYEFTNWPLIINAALAELQKRAPRKSGRFASSFIVIAGGAVVADFKSIPAEGEVIITNFSPTVRKVETGRLGIPRRRLFDGTKNVLARRFGAVARFETRFLDIKSGVHAMIPYRLKRSGARKDRLAGMPITYPAIIVNTL